MSRSHQSLVGVRRTTSLSRRSFLARSTSLVAMADTQNGCDHAHLACEAWLERHRECDTLSTRADAIESLLVERCDWHQLSNRRRAAFPQAIELDAIDDRRDELKLLNEGLLARIPAIAATTAQGVIAKLAVAVACMPGADHGPAQHLVQSALSDLQSLTGASLRQVHA